jgi:hypothetical protein
MPTVRKASGDLTTNRERLHSTVGNPDTNTLKNLTNKPTKEPTTPRTKNNLPINTKPNNQTNTKYKI